MLSNTYTLNAFLCIFGGIDQHYSDIMPYTPNIYFNVKWHREENS
jgi:hypothetical protein